jgi:hypothetical protein
MPFPPPVTSNGTFAQASPLAGPYDAHNNTSAVHQIDRQPVAHPDAGPISAEEVMTSL